MNISREDLWLTIFLLMLQYINAHFLPIEQTSNLDRELDGLRHLARVAVLLHGPDELGDGDSRQSNDGHQGQRQHLGRLYTLACKKVKEVTYSNIGDNSG